MSEESSDDICVDFRGRPCRPSKHGGTRAALFVLGIPLLLSLTLTMYIEYIDQTRASCIWPGWSMLSILDTCQVKLIGCVYIYLYSGFQAFEMMAIAAVGNNLITYVFNEMHFPLSKSANLVTNFIGTVFLLSLLGGFLSDSYLGSFRTMLFFGVIEISVCTSPSLALFSPFSFLFQMLLNILHHFSSLTSNL